LRAINADNTGSGRANDDAARDGRAGCECCGVGLGVDGCRGLRADGVCGLGSNGADDREGGNDELLGEHRDDDYASMTFSCLAVFVDEAGTDRNLVASFIYPFRKQGTLTTVVKWKEEHTKRGSTNF